MASLPLLPAFNEYNNPLGQNLILKLILEHVGDTDVNDLLNCRLVSHSWNRVAVQVLEHQHGYALELDYKKLLKFKSLLWISRMSRMNSERQELESLRLSLTLLPKKCSENCNPLIDSAQLLAFHQHLRLAFITLDYELKCGDMKIEPTQPNMPNQASWNSLTNLELFTFFKLASPHLTKLTILDNHEQIPPHFEKFDFDSYLDLEFPRLTSIYYEVASSRTEPTDLEMLDLNNHLTHIIKRAPKLIKLQLYVGDGLDSTKTILESCSASLEELDFMNAYMGLVKLLAEIKFPKLRLFTAKKVYSTSVLNEFAQLNCPELMLTHININLDDQFDLSEDSEDLLNFPLLPNILNFGLYSIYRTSNRLNELIRKIFSQILPKLTSLKSLSLDLGILVLMGANLRNSGQLIPSQDQYPVFPAISTLEIHMPVVRTNVIAVLDKTFRIYHHTFPNLETLIIKPNMEDTLRDEKKLDYHTIEFLCFHPGIQKLEIHNYAEDWLNQPSILNPSGFPRVKSLKLFTPPKGEDGPRMNLMELLTRFPALEFLQMGKELVSTTEIQGLQKLIKRLENPFTRNRKRTH